MFKYVNVTTFLLPRNWSIKFVRQPHYKVDSSYVCFGRRSVEVKGEGGISRLLYLHTGRVLVRVISYDNVTSLFSSLRPSVCKISQGLREANLTKLIVLTRRLITYNEAMRA